MSGRESLSGPKLVISLLSPAHFIISTALTISFLSLMPFFVSPWKFPHQSLEKSHIAGRIPNFFLSRKFLSPQPCFFIRPNVMSHFLLPLLCRIHQYHCGIIEWQGRKFVCKAEGSKVAHGPPSLEWCRLFAGIDKTEQLRKSPYD